MTLGKHWAAVIALCLAAQAYPATTGRNAPLSPGTAPRNDLADSLSHRPVVFEPNVGQFEPGVRYRADAAGMSLSLTDAAAVLSLGSEPDSRRPIRITPVNASRRVRPRALDRLAGVVNHFESAAPSTWHAGVPTYGRVRYPAVYPGIDLVYHGSPDQLEYDFVVGRGADPSRIALRFDGADRVELDHTGDLLIHAGETVVRQRAPYAFQEHGRERRRVDARYRLTKAGDVAFTIGAYDHRLPLVIDPILLYSSYLNAQSARIATDAAGYVIVVTWRFQLPQFVPTGLKVERLTPDGQTAVYTTLIGPSAGSTSPMPADFYRIGGVAATQAGEAIVTGGTASPDLPLVNASQGYPGDAGKDNAFVFKLGPDGSFVFSTYLGGTNHDSASGVSVNQSGTIAVVGSTSSQDFPGVDGLRIGMTDFVTVFAADGSRRHGALLPVAPIAVTIDGPGSVYVAASTYSTTWPTTPESFQPTPHVAQCGDYGGSCLQGVLAKLSADLGSLVYSTYLHPTGPQTQEVDLGVKALAVDAAGAAYILGYARNGAFGATTGALQEQCPAGYSCAFLAKLNPAGSGRVYSTFLSGNPTALQVDARGNVYLAGAYVPPTPNAQQPRAADAPLFVTTDGGTTWRRTQGSLSPRSLAVAHGTGSLLYAADYDGISRSTDLGDHWERLDPEFSDFLVVAPGNANVVYAASWPGALMRRSTDGGATWATLGLPLTAYTLAVDPVDAQTLYAGGEGLFKSVNGGNTWSPASSGIEAGMFVGKIIAAPSNRNVLFATTSSYSSPERFVFYRTADAGASWTPIVSPLGPSYGRVAFDPLDATRVYTTDGFLIERSTDGGATWTLFAESTDMFCGAAIAVTRTPDPTVFVACYDGVKRAVDTGGATPIPLTLSLPNGGVNQLAVDRVDLGVLVAATYSVADGLLSVIDPTGARVRYASYFGGKDTDSIDEIALGSGGTLAATGRTASRDLPLVNPRIPGRRADRADAFVALMRIPLPATVIDAPTAGSIGQVFNVSGWAIDTGAPAGGGVDAVHVWAFPQNGSAPVFVGVASYGGARPDVGTAYGAQFTNSGFTLTGARLPEGSYTLAAFARSTVSETFEAATRSVQVVSGARMSIDAPTADAFVYQPFTIAGWALDAAAPSGTGVDTVHVWAYPDGGAPRFVGGAAYGGNRPDVGDAFGSRFAASGFTLQASGLPTGTSTLAVFARSLVSGTFDLVRTVRVTLPDGGAASIDAPVAGSVVSNPFVVAGWALDRQGEGTGIDAIHIWAYPAAGGAPTFLAATTGLLRPDVATAFGDPRFTPSGYSVTATLPPGAYTVVVYARSTATGAFSIVRSVQVTVN